MTFAPFDFSPVSYNVCPEQFNPFCLECVVLISNPHAWSLIIGIQMFANTKRLHGIKTIINRFVSRQNGLSTPMLSICYVIICWFGYVSFLHAFTLDSFVDMSPIFVALKHVRIHIQVRLQIFTIFSYGPINHTTSTPLQSLSPDSVNFTPKSLILAPISHWEVMSFPLEGSSSPSLP